MRVELVEAESRATIAHAAAHASELAIATQRQQVAFDREQVAALEARTTANGMELDTIEPMFGIMKELNLQFVLGYTPEEFARSLHLLADGKVDAPSLITGKVGLGDVKGAFAELANPERHTKILVEPWR